MPHSGSALIDPYIVFEKIALAPGMRVADLGCGRTGHFVFPASRVVGDGGVVYAVEIVKNILESIKSRVRSEGYHNVSPIWSDIERVGGTPIPPAALDGCFMVNVLFLLKDRVAAFREAARLTTTSGFVVAVDWRKNLGLIGPTADHLVLPEAAIAAGTEAGLSVADSFPLGDYHYCVIFKKI